MNIDANENLGRDRQIVVNKIIKWLSDEKNQEYIRDIRDGNKIFYTQDSINTIKGIYEVIENGNEENKKELNEFILNKFGVTIAEIDKINLYKIYDNVVNTNIENIKKEKIQELNVLELIEALTKSDNIINNELEKEILSDESNFKLFVSKVLDMELTEIKGWLIAAIKSDYEDIKNIIIESNDSNEAKFKIFEFINSRSLIVEGNKVENPFKIKERKVYNKDEYIKQVDFTYAKAGMPDVLYFPKNESVKPITAINVTSDPSKSNNLLIHSLRASFIGNKIIEESKNSSVFEVLNNLKSNSKIDAKNDLNIYTKLNIIELLLNKDKSIDIQKIFDKMDFSVILHTSSLSIFNKNKITLAERDVLNQSDPDYLKKLETFNVSMYGLLQSTLEDNKIDTLSVSKEDKTLLKNYLNDLIYNVEMCILSKEGKLTSINKQNLDIYVQNVAELFTNKDSFQNYLNFNKTSYNGQNSLSDGFKSIITQTFKATLNDSIGERKLIKGLAENGSIDYESFVKKDEFDKNDLNTLVNSINKVIDNYKNTNKDDILLKIDNLKNTLNEISNFQQSYADRDLDKESINLKNILD